MKYMYRHVWLHVYIAIAVQGLQPTMNTFQNDFQLLPERPVIGALPILTCPQFGKVPGTAQHRLICVNGQEEHQLLPQRVHVSNLSSIVVAMLAPDENHTEISENPGKPTK